MFVEVVALRHLHHMLEKSYRVLITERHNSKKQSQSPLTKSWDTIASAYLFN